MAEEYQSEIHKILKLTEADMIVMPKASSKPLPVPKPAAQPSFIPTDLPVADFAAEFEKPIADHVFDTILRRTPPVPQVGLPFTQALKVEQKKRGVFAWIRSLLVYPVIFIVSFSFFYVLFNFSSLVSQVNAWFTKPEDEQILKEDLTSFYGWMNGYYFATGDRTILEPNNDIDKDGLSNLDEFIIRTNPTISDSDGDGFSDGIETINSSNPWGSNAITSEQEKLRESLDLIKINNRVTFNAINVAEHVQEEPAISYDLNRSGTLSIPKLGLQVPLIWSKDPKDFEVDLTKGVVHYPGTALPGEKGTVYVSGHSSDYLWKKHPYKQVFAKLNALEKGDDIFVDIYGLDGKTYNYRYVASDEQVFKPDDQSQFIDNSTAKLNLSTCWPIGTQRDRYVVSATLVPL